MSVEAPAERGGRLSQVEADQVLIALQSTLSGTKFQKAWPAEIPGLVALQLENGEIAYTDKSARYFFIGLVLDTTTGRGLDRRMDAATEND